MILAGAAVAVAAATLNALSVVLLAVEVRQEPDRDAMHVSLFRRLSHRPGWLLATGMMVVAGFAQTGALVLAPLAVVQPMLSTSQLVLLGVARVKLGERVGVHEVVSALAIIAGLAAVVWAAPTHSAPEASAGALTPPLAVVGGAAVIAFVLGRAHPRAQWSLVLGSGIAYAWADFVVKLIAGSASSGQWLLVLVWVPLLLVVGGMAFLEENTALQRRPVVTVAPVISAVKVPLPVLMALAAGLEHWVGGPPQIAIMAAGLALVAAGAAGLGRSGAVARVATGPSGRLRGRAGGGARPSPRSGDPQEQETSGLAGVGRSEPLMSSDAAAPGGNRAR